MTEDDGKTTNGSNGHGAGEQEGTYVVEYKPLATVIEYKTKKRVTLADQLEEIHKKLIDNKRYRGFMEWTSKFETADAFLAMMMIDHADKHEITLLIPDGVQWPEHVVKLKMRVAWRRFKDTARTDRRMIKFVPSEPFYTPPPAK
jgi:hypothetical protein